VAWRRSDREFPFAATLVHKPGDPALEWVEDDQHDHEAKQQVDPHATRVRSLARKIKGVPNFTNDPWLAQGSKACSLNVKFIMIGVESL
jgi:hypothetical protein